MSDTLKDTVYVVWFSPDVTPKERRKREWQLRKVEAAGGNVIRLAESTKRMYFMSVGGGGNHLEMEECQHSDLYTHRKVGKERRRECAVNGWPWPPPFGATGSESTWERYREFWRAVAAEREAPQRQARSGVTQGFAELGMAGPPNDGAGSLPALEGPSGWQEPPEGGGESQLGAGLGIDQGPQNPFERVEEINDGTLYMEQFLALTGGRQQ